MQLEPVFYDPSGRRRKLFTGIAAITALVAAILATLFLLTLLFVPFLPSIPGLSGLKHHLKQPTLPSLPERETRLSRFLLRQSRLDLWREIEEQNRSRSSVIPPLGKGSPIVAAFYAPWQETGLHSFRANANRLTHVMPEWLHLNAKGTDFDTRDWDPSVTPRNLDVVRIATEHQVAIHPILNNAENGKFDPIRVHQLFNSEQNEGRFCRNIRDWLVQHKFQGLNLDFENLYPIDYVRELQFITTLAGVLHEAHLALSVDIEAENNAVPIHRISNLCDFVVLMAYDEHYVGGEPGPIASIGWYNHVMELALRSVPSDKLVVGVGNYAYDWTENKKSAEDLSYQSTLILARDYRLNQGMKQLIDFDPDALNSTFDYEDDEHHAHTVWSLDAISAYNQWLLAKREGVKGLALWVLGSEDPGVWSFFDRYHLYGSIPPQVLKEVVFPYEIEFEGNGEILSILSQPEKGSREIKVDPETGLCVDMEYLRLPSSYVIRRSGYHPHWISLTFDDGPSSEYTPQILDVLKDFGIEATFFVIGENAERYPDLIRRIWREGHEVGNHTFTHPNIADISHERVLLELNTTQRAIESILGRSTLMFRAPYNADAEPVSAEEVRPILDASKLGYITVGELVDPQDWNLTKILPNGSQVPRSSQDIADGILRDIHVLRGNIVLLHDGGGNRKETVEAVRLIIPELRREGYRFVRISELLNTTREALMPPVSKHDRTLVGFDSIVFETTFTIEMLLSLAFIAAIFLGIGRVLFTIPLALVQNKKKREVPQNGINQPTISVLIATHNEERVIVKTIQKVFENDHPILELIVVDDGSTDTTLESIQEHYPNESRLRLMRLNKMGKAAALNVAMKEASGEILVCLDADTQITPESISFLVEHFENPKVGAVAGNIKVGNRVNALTLWQSIEYITSQNLDRRAYALLNAVTVVPGAIGAWRKSAVQGVGGYVTDTMAEDMDLTWRLRQAGWWIENEPNAVGYTEAPDSLSALFRQRFRWAFGTLQCLAKHRNALFHYGAFGWIALPSLWLFQIVFQMLAPLVDLQAFYTTATFVNSWVTRGIFSQDWQPLPQATHLLLQTGFYYALFFAVDLLGGLVAFWLDQEDFQMLWWLFFQRFAYRQLMYAVLWRSLLHALRGIRFGWGKLERKGTVNTGEIEKDV